MSNNLISPLDNDIKKMLLYGCILRVWRNGRRACLRGKWETVWVQVPSLAPKEKDRKVFFYWCWVRYNVRVCHFSGSPKSTYGNFLGERRNRVKSENLRKANWSPKREFRRRRACLRGKWETVWVQVPSLAPKNTKKDPDSCVYWRATSTQSRTEYARAWKYPSSLALGSFFVFFTIYNKKRATKYFVSGVPSHTVI